jgi:hypothetical protein
VQRLALLGLLLTCLSLPLASLAAFPAPAGDDHLNRPVLVVTLPGTAPADVVARAGGRLVGLANAPLAVFAVDASHVAGSDAVFNDRLRRSGAVLVLDGRALLALCGG